MVFVWIAVGCAIITIMVLVYKILKIPNQPYTISWKCKKCGMPTNGLKCITCNSKNKMKKFDI